MSDWSWKQAIAERIVEVANANTGYQVALDDVYAIESVSPVAHSRHSVGAVARTVIEAVQFRIGGRHPTRRR